MLKQNYQFKTVFFYLLMIVLYLADNNIIQKFYNLVGPNSILFILFSLSLISLKLNTKYKIEHILLFLVIVLMISLGHLEKLSNFARLFFSFMLFYTYFYTFQTIEYIEVKKFKKFILIILILEVILILIFSQLEISYFGTYGGDREALNNYRGIQVYTGMHTGGVSLTHLYILAYVFFINNFKSILYRLCFVAFLGALLYFTGSRTAMLLVLFMAIFQIFFNRKIFAAVTTALILNPIFFGLVIFFYESELETLLFVETSGRLNAWLFHLDVFLSSYKHIFLGIPPNTYAYEYNGNYIGAHNLPWDLLMKCGIIVYVIVCVIFYFLAKHCRQKEYQIGIILILFYASLNMNFTALNLSIVSLLLLLGLSRYQRFSI